jgi:hypothetical protein
VLGSALLASAGAAIGVLLATSRGRPRQFLDKDGRPLPCGISDKVFVEINGLRQGMFIKGRDLRNPVLLYLHGGIPDMFLTEKYPTGLENLFTVVWWEQRGAGMSFRADLPTESLTLDQFVSEAYGDGSSSVSRHPYMVSWVAWRRPPSTSRPSRRSRSRLRLASRAGARLA